MSERLAFKIHPHMLRHGSEFGKTSGIVYAPDFENFAIDRLAPLVRLSGSQKMIDLK